MVKIKIIKVITIGLASAKKLKNTQRMSHKHIKIYDLNKTGLLDVLAMFKTAKIIKINAAIFNKPNIGIQPSNVPKTKETMAMILPRWMWFEVFINQNYSKVCKSDTFLMWKPSDFFCFFKKQNFPRSTLIFFENFLKKSLKIKKNQQFFLYQKGKLA